MCVGGGTCVGRCVWGGTCVGRCVCGRGTCVGRCVCGRGTRVGRCVRGRMRTFSLYFLFSSKMKDFENFLIKLR